MDNIFVGSRLTKLREKKGLTQEQVAKKASLNLKDYQTMEQGKEVENFDRYYKACKALDCDISDLFDAQTYINYNYGENSPNGFYPTTSYYNRDKEDVKMLNNMADSLKSVMAHLDVLSETINKVVENLNQTAKDKDKKEE